MTVSDDTIMCELIQQVTKAVPAGKSELAVTTVITLPMWQAWCRAVELPTWALPHHGWGVYGSFTIVLDCEELFSYSYPTKHYL